MTGVELTAGRTVEITGTVRGRKVLRHDERERALATLIMEDGDRRLPVIWWDPSFAPPDGAHVWIRGRINEFNGKIELRADETWVDRTSVAGNGPLSSIASFYLACVEAEAALQLRLIHGHEDHIVLHDTPSPLHETLVFPETSQHHQWLQARATGPGEPLLVGWPLVVGIDPETRRGGLARSPLLVAEAEVEASDGVWTLRISNTRVDLNPFALDLLGLDRDSRAEVARVVGTSVEVDEAVTPAARAYALLAALEDQGIDGLMELDPAALSTLPETEGIHNAGVVMAVSTRAHFTRNLVADLVEIANYPDRLAEGPAAILLGQATPAAPTPLELHHTIVNSSLNQEKVIHSAMVNDFTVVTGPPGTGKSQVLVNVVAAAVARGDTVLITSRNNGAVDVVVDRLRRESPNSIVVRALTASKRGELAADIVHALEAVSPDAHAGDGREAWTRVEESLRPLYAQLHEWTKLKAERANLEAGRKAILAALPPSIRTDVDLPRLEAALADACRALDAFGARLGWFARRRRHRERLARAHQALGRLGDLLGAAGADDIKACLAPVNGKPRRTRTPRNIFRPVEWVVGVLRAASGHLRRIDEIDTRLRALPQKHQFDDQLHEHNRARSNGGARLLEARWNEVRHDNPRARQEALKLVRNFRRMSSEGLPALPVWAVTNLSVRANLNLEPGLFDLVIIDEASQSDVASALPVLVRGKRALIVGDGNQLVHITSLGDRRERLLAKKYGLTDDQADEFSYIHTSCFELARSRVPAGPILLDLHFRSHAAIIGFSSKQFYAGNLELCSAATPPETLRPFEWIRAVGRSERGSNGRSRLNRVEAKNVTEVIERDLQTYRGNDCSVGVVTPFVEQAKLIRKLLRKVHGIDQCKELMVATAHRFQGGERDVMYFSPVIDRHLAEPEVRFAADRNLVNVALTRARKRLVIVGDIEACLAHDNALSELALYARRLEESGFHGPLELALHDRLRKEGIAVRKDVEVGPHRLGLAVEHGGVRLDIEYDGAAFGTGKDEHARRDRDIRSAGWTVLRFSPRELSRDLEPCLERIRERIKTS